MSVNEKAGVSSKQKKKPTSIAGTPGSTGAALMAGSFKPLPKNVKKKEDAYSGLKKKPKSSAAKVPKKDGAVTKGKSFHPPLRSANGEEGDSSRQKKRP